MKKILLFYFFVSVNYIYSMYFIEPYLEDGKSYFDQLVNDMDNRHWASHTGEYRSFFLIDALNTQLSDNDSEVMKQFVLPPSRTPVFDSFVYCAFTKNGAEIADASKGKIRVSNYDAFLSCIERACNKSNPTIDQKNRIKSIRKFIMDWPKKDVAILGNFTVSISTSKMNRFHELISDF